MMINYRIGRISHALCTSVFDVIVVNIQLSARVSRASSIEGDGNEARSESVVKDVASPCTIIIAVVKHS